MTYKTPLERLIEITESEMDKYAANFLGRTLSEKGRAVYDGTLLAFSLFVKRAKSFLPEERKMVEDAFMAGDKYRTSIVEDWDESGEGDVNVPNASQYLDRLYQNNNQ